VFSVTFSSLFGQNTVYRRPAHAEDIGNRARRLTARVHPLRESRLLLVKHRAWRHYERTRTARLPACQSMYDCCVSVPGLRLRAMDTGLPTAAPSGVVTFLFTDVEGSTRRWEADAEGMRAALTAHDEVLRSAIETYGGFMFKHTGDGICAAFNSPKSAVDAAVAAQHALELSVRMGIATGEAELRDGDYFGAVLNRAARVMAAGHGGQILVADSTAGLLSGVDLMDLGPRRLRDVAAPIGVFQVRAAGLRTEFPALRALDASPGNLRAATTSLIGRETEVAEIQAAVPRSLSERAGGCQSGTAAMLSGEQRSQRRPPPHSQQQP
jgi:class 3 adenylate cyclase